MHTERLLSTLQNCTKVFHVDSSPAHKQAQSRGKLDTSAPNIRTSQDPVWNKATPRKNRSVADLRKAFEPGSAAKVPQRPSVSLPNTPQRQVGTNTKVPGNAIDSCGRRDTMRDNKFGGRVGLETAVSPAQHSRIWSRLPVRQLQNTPTIRQAEGKGLRESLVDELEQTIRHRAGSLEPGNLVPGDPVGRADSHLDSPWPLLPTRALPLRGNTVRPASESGLPKPSPRRRATQNTDPLPEARHHATETRRARTSLAETQHLQHWSTRKDSAPDSQLVPIRGSPSKPFSDGATNTVSKGPQNQTSGVRDSPVREGIHVFEKLRRPAGSREANRRNVTSSGETFNPQHVRRSSWGLKLNSQTLRSVSAGVRRKLSTGKGQNEASKGGPKSSIPIFKRHALPYFGAASPSELLAAEPRREPSFSFRATLRKISKSHHSTDTASPAAARLRPRATPSLELLNKTSKIAPRPFPSIRTISGRLLKNHRTILNPTWSSQTRTSNENDDNSLPHSHANANANANRAPQNPHTEHNTTPKRRLHHKSSLSDALGGSWGKTAATTLLSQAPAVARDIASHTARSGFQAYTHTSREKSGQSWGRRASAREGPGFGIGVQNSDRVESNAVGTDAGGAWDKVAGGGAVGRSENDKKLGMMPPASGFAGE